MPPLANPALYAPRNVCRKPYDYLTISRHILKVLEVHKIQKSKDQLWHHSENVISKHDEDYFLCRKTHFPTPAPGPAVHSLSISALLAEHDTSPALLGPGTASDTAVHGSV